VRRAAHRAEPRSANGGAHSDIRTSKANIARNEAALREVIQGQ
jgi:hypothetical protein